MSAGSGRVRHCWKPVGGVGVRYILQDLHAVAWNDICVVFLKIIDVIGSLGTMSVTKGQKLYEYVELVVLRGGGGAVLMWMWICVCLTDCDNVVGVLESSSWK